LHFSRHFWEILILINAVINHCILYTCARSSINLSVSKLLFNHARHVKFQLHYWLTPNQSLCYPAAAKQKSRVRLPEGSRTPIKTIYSSNRVDGKSVLRFLKCFFKFTDPIYRRMIFRIQCETNWMCFWYWWVEELLERTATSSAINKTAATPKTLPARRRFVVIFLAKFSGWRELTGINRVVGFFECKRIDLHAKKSLISSLYVFWIFLLHPCLVYVK